MKRHPGQILAHEFMVPLRLSANQVARGLGVNRSTVGRLIAGQQRMSPEMAARLGTYFQVPAKWWLQMQADYDIEQLQVQPELTENVTPLEIDPSILLTPKGVMRLGAPEEPTPPPSLSRTELERLPQVSSPRTREVQVVRYENGSLALVGES